MYVLHLFCPVGMFSRDVFTSQAVGTGLHRVSSKNGVPHPARDRGFVRQALAKSTGYPVWVNALAYVRTSESPSGQE
jgi:hypothetical protein